ncbi:Pkinase-domain-containing protein [Martensiomyces pterosporus]|nr:Pkinase-domain-containing protein [Martensiomyces pterosporus]
MDTSRGAAAATAGGSGIPTALRHLLTKGAKQHAAQIDGIVLSKSIAPMQADLQYRQPSFGQTLVAHNADAIMGVHPSVEKYQQQPVAGSNGQRSGSNAIGAWLSKYNLRPGNSGNNNGRTSVNSTTSTATAASVANALSSTPAEPSLRPSLEDTRALYASDSSTLSASAQGGGPAFAAYITGAETREQPAASSGLRMGRKKHLVYRILVSGRNGQWWVMRRYSEFDYLYQTLKRRFPQKAHHWSELFPGKRLLPALSSSAEMAMQRREQLNGFLRAVTNDTDVCPCEEMQCFLHDTSFSIEGMTLSPDQVEGDDKEVQMSSPEDGPHVHHAGHRLPLPGEWSAHNFGGLRKGRDSLERMSSMPMLKDGYMYANQSGANQMGASPETQAADEPQISVPRKPTTAAALPARPGGYPNLGLGNPKLPFTPLLDDEDAAQILRKASDPLLYVSAEKRPNAAHFTVRKKYGLRRNLQYLDDAQTQTQDTDKQMSGSAPIPSPSAEMSLMSSRDVTLAGFQAQTMVNTMTWADHSDTAEEYDNSDVDMEAASPPHDKILSDVTAKLMGHKQQYLMDQQPVSQAFIQARANPKGGVTKAKHLPEEDAALVSEREQLRQQRRLSGAMMTDTTNTLMGTIAAEASPADGQQACDRYLVTAPRKKIGLDDFHLLSVIGKGSYGKVMLTRYKDTGKVMAIKVISKSKLRGRPNEIRRVMSERRVLERTDTGKVMAIKVISKSKLRGRPNEIRRVMSERRVLERTVQHPFLVGLQCAFQTKEKLYFCLDYVNGGELFFHLQRERRFAENRARFYAAEITSALAYLHGMDVVYRDLKPENCLLDARGHVRIVDFGLAKEVGPVVWRTEGSALYSVEGSGKTATFCGTPEYLAPEVLLRQSYGKEVDWYCLGAVLYEMLTGLPPFYDQDNNVMYRRILQEPLRFPSSLPPVASANGTMYPGSNNIPSSSIGRLAQDFIFKMMERDPNRRLGHGVFGTENVKRHPFFYGIDWGKIYRQEYAPPFIPKVSSIFDLSNIDPEFRNEPIPESILAEGQVDILAEAAEAERKAELAQHAQLMAFPSPGNAPTANSMFADSRATRAGAGGDQASYADANAAASGPSDPASNDAAFQGFSFTSPWVDVADDE